jgi:hypothetical protein
MKAQSKVECTHKDSLNILEEGKVYTVEKLVQLGAYHHYEQQVALIEVPYYLWKFDRFKVVETL